MKTYRIEGIKWTDCDDKRVKGPKKATVTLGDEFDDADEQEVIDAITEELNDEHGDEGMVADLDIYNEDGSLFGEEE